MITTIVFGPIKLPYKRLLTVIIFEATLQVGLAFNGT